MAKKPQPLCADCGERPAFDEDYAYCKECWPKHYRFRCNACNRPADQIGHCENCGNPEFRIEKRETPLKPKAKTAAAKPRKKPTRQKRLIEE